jgi:RNA polymerase sigma factor (sigma-70 family)
MDPRLEQMVIAGLPGAKACAAKWRQRLHPAELEDLFEVTSEALVKAAAAWVDPYCSSRGFDPWDADDPGRPHQAWAAYAAQTMNGAVLDWARRRDHVSRSNRGRLKQIGAARQDGARTDEELSAATGIPVAKVRRALAADGVKPVSLDGQQGDFSDVGVTAFSDILADDSAEGDVEGQAEVHAMLAAFLAAYDALDPVQQVLLAFVYHQEMPLEIAAKACYLTEAEAERLHGEAVDRIHQALLRAVSS